MTAGSGLTLAQARADPELWGRLVESAVGAHLVNAPASGAADSARVEHDIRVTLNPCLKEAQA